MEKTPMETILKTKGMHCKSCEMLISDSISEIAGAKVLSASHASGEVKVQYENAQVLEKIKQAIRKEGYKI